jgi:nucleolar protein 4
VQVLSQRDAQKAIEAVNGKKLKDRPIAVDLALSKKEFVALPESKDEDTGRVEAADEDSGEDQSDDEVDEEDDEQDGEKGTRQWGGQKKTEEEEGDEESRAVSRARLLAKKNQELECTLFVRNLNFDTTDDELGVVMRRFGVIKSVKLVCISFVTCSDKQLISAPPAFFVQVFDSKSGQNKGTAFVQFTTPEAAEAAIVAGTIDDSSQRSAVSVEHRKGIVIDGRPLILARALGREQAAHVNTKDASAKKDKRNLYLNQEGFIKPDSKAGLEMPKTDLEKRQRASNEKKVPQ